MAVPRLRRCRRIYQSLSLAMTCSTAARMRRCLPLTTTADCLAMAATKATAFRKWVRGGTWGASIVEPDPTPRRPKRGKRTGSLERCKVIWQPPVAAARQRNHTRTYPGTAPTGVAGTARMRTFIGSSGRMTRVNS